MSTATIQAQLDADFNAQKDTQTAQMASGRVAHLFKPGTYAVHDNVGFYTSVAGLGQNPDDVMINGDVTVDAFNASDAGNATQNFWRSAENLAITPSSGSRPLGGGAGRAVPPDRRARRPAAVPGQLRLRQRRLHRRHVRSPGRPSSVSQQQWYTRDSNLGSWTGGVWNMVFSGTTGRPGQRPSRARRRPRWPPRRSPATCPTCTSTAPASTGCSCRRCAPTHPAPSWASGSTPGHVAADEPVLRRQVRPTPRRPSTPRWPRAATCSSPPASTTSTRRSTSPGPTPSCWASATRR